MNAAAKLINQSSLFHGQISQIKCSLQVKIITVLLFCLIMTAIGVIYNTNEFRLSINQLQQLELQQNQLNLDWDQLLLEEASLSTSSRMSQLVSQQLQMHFPYEQEIKVLHIK